MTTPEQPPASGPPTPSAATPPPISGTYPVYGRAGEQPSTDDSPTDTGRYATYNAATANRSGGGVVFAVVALAVFIVFGVAAVLMFRFATSDVGYEEPAPNIPSELLDDPNFPGSGQ